MSLFGWRDTPYDIEADVRSVLERSGETDTSSAACQRWVRRLIWAYVPDWRPGDDLAWDDAWRIGQAFEELVQSPRPTLAEHPRKCRAGRKPYTRRAA